MTTQFYTFDQNTSSGIFVTDSQRGIAEFVIIEAPYKQNAIHIAHRIGLYFNGVGDGIDCPCCGDRWNSDPQAYDVPSIYGGDVSQGVYYDMYEYITYRPAAYIHYLAGTITEVRFGRKEQQ